MENIIKCEDCETKLFIYEGKNSIYAYCPKCIEERRLPFRIGVCCLNPQIEPVISNMQGGGFQIRQQCRNCGNSGGPALKKNNYDVSKLKHRDENRQKMYYESIKLDYEEFKLLFDKFKQQNYTFEHQFPGYTKYLSSDKWKRKRELVFQRDNKVCQSCLSNAANQVHHLTYKHIFNEPLFDLISVCNICHENITNMDRKKEFENI